MLRDQANNWIHLLLREVILLISLPSSVWRGPCFSFTLDFWEPEVHEQ